MKIHLAELGTHLKQGLQKLYLITGDENLLVEETAQYLKKLVKQQGFTAHEHYLIDTKFKWSELSNNQESLSLFDEKKIIELEFRQAKLNKEASDYLKTLEPYINDNNFWIIRLPKLTLTEQKAAWFNTLENLGVIIQIAAIKRTELPQWISKRLARLGYQTSSAALQLIADYCEDNLLAARQTVEKISLLYPVGELTTVQVQEFLQDHASFDHYALLDSILLQQLPRSQRILKNLQATTSSEAVLVLWLIQKELHILADCRQALEQKKNLASVWKSHGVWAQRQSLLQQHLKKFSVANYFALLTQCHKVDSCIKISEPQVAWQALEDLVLACCNPALIPQPTMRVAI